MKVLDDVNTILKYNIKPNFSILGQKYGKDLNRILNELKLLSTNKVIDELNQNQSIKVLDYVLTKEDIDIEEIAYENYSLSSNIDIKVADYHQSAISSGSDAKAAAYIELEKDGKTFWGVGINPNTTRASFDAIIVGLSKLLNT